MAPLSSIVGLVLLVVLFCEVSAQPRHTGLGNLPAGVLREQIVRLPGNAQKKALAALSKVSFRKEDAGRVRVDAQGDVFIVDDKVDSNGIQYVSPLPAMPFHTYANAANGLPLLHSRPGSPNVIFLDFDGHTITGAAWNNGRAATLVALPYDLDASPSTFGTSEQTAITNIWRRVSEDYAPFNVDVTTEQPAVFTATTGRVLITNGTDANGNLMPSNTAGGVAYINVFGGSTYGYYSPALVYFTNLGGGREDYVSEACTHEMGHNLGLSHDGTNATGYYSGAGSGATSWAPIMGVGYNKAVSKWNNGDYPLANNQEDDITMISSKLPLLADVIGNTFALAAPLTVSGTAVSGSGLIETVSDVDMWTFTTAAGAVTITVSPFKSSINTAGGNLDVQAALYRSDNTLVTSSDDSTVTTATISATLAAGTYFLRVAPSFSAGVYTLYGSVGQYSISGTVPSGSATDTVPPTAVLASAPTVSVGGGTSYSFSVRYTDTFGLDVTSIDSADIVVRDPTNVALAVTFVSVDINSNGSPRQATYSISAPGGSWDAVDAGTYTVTLQASQVRDTSGNFAAGVSLGSFSCNIVPDTTAPTVVVTSKPDVTTESAAAYVFGVTYSDNVNVVSASIDAADITVSGPNGYVATGIAVSKSSSSDATTITVQYSFSGPNGIWNTAANGVYNIALVANQVRDTSNNAVLAASLGSFTVNIAPLVWSSLYLSSMDTNPGWSVQGKWVWGKYTASNGPKDGRNVVAFGLSGTNLYAEPDRNVYCTTTAPFSTKGSLQVTVAFDRFYGVRSDDTTDIQVRSCASSHSTTCPCTS